MSAHLSHTSGFIGGVVLAFLVAGSPAGGLGEQPDSVATVARFTAAVTTYVALHRQVERSVPPQQIFTDPDEAERAVRALADAMRRSRPDAREGDIFTADVGILFRHEILEALRKSDFEVQTLLEETIAETLEEVAPPTVNGAFSWALGNAMPPCVLHALPELPIELQYRFVGVDLILIDIHADLVVDILRDAIPAPTSCR